MKKRLFIFVCGFFLLPLSVFALANVQSGSMTAPILYGDNGFIQIPRPVLSQIPRNERPVLRKERNTIRQSQSRTDRLKKQLKQVHDQIQKLQKKAEQLKKQLSEVKEDNSSIDLNTWKTQRPMIDDSKIDLNIWELQRKPDIDLNTWELQPMMKGNEDIKKRRPPMMQNIKRRVRQWEGVEIDEAGEMKMDANMFSSDQEKVRERASEAQSKLSRFRSFFRFRR